MGYFYFSKWETEQAAQTHEATHKSSFHTARSSWDLLLSPLPGLEGAASATCWVPDPRPFGFI